MVSSNDSLCNFRVSQPVSLIPHSSHPYCPWGGALKPNHTTLTQMQSHFLFYTSFIYTSSLSSTHSRIVTHYYTLHSYYYSMKWKHSNSYTYTYTDIHIQSTSSAQWMITPSISTIVFWNFQCQAIQLDKLIVIWHPQILVPFLE